MNMAECAILCHHFGISLDALMGVAAVGGEYIYTPLDLRSTDGYLNYMRALADRLERLSMTPDAEIILSAVDVPFFHFLQYKELTLFKLFAWTNSVYGNVGRFEDFARAIETPALLDVYRRIVAAYRLIPQREIWTRNTVDTFLTLVRFNFEMGNFADPRTAVVLCEQFGNLLNRLQSQAETGFKGSTGCIPFGLYLSEMDLENNFILLRSGAGLSCILKLFTINSLYITDPKFCTETLGWLDQLTRRSLLISVSSEKERRRFFVDQHEKISILAELVG